ncbi:PAS domain S-box protein [Dyella ginsengisoli]|uniref:PAS domain S-box protein n=1 Tax=Dyella ginsengisoli TaxID=363848 RepID=UPI00034919E3|nr:PAS domain S-box protein [Dyella ginsengisoli]
MASVSIAGNEYLLRTLFDTVPDAMVVVDRSGDIVLANPQAHRLFGYVPDGLPGLAIEALLPEGVRAAHARHRERYMSHPRVRPMGAGYELTGLRRNGETFPVEVALSPIGRELFAASIRDISETQRVRQALQHARYDSYLAQLGRLLLESSQDESARTAVPALIAEALGVEAVAVAVGLPDGEALPIRASHGVPPRLADALPEAFASDRLAERLADFRSSGIWTLSRSPAHDLPALRSTLDAHGFADMAIVPLLDRFKPTGALLAMSLASDDCDNDKSNFLRLSAHLLASAIQRSRSDQQLAHAHQLDALGQLSGGIAHDFNNMLTIISGNLQMLDAERAGDPGAHPLIESALRAVDHGAALTRKLLGFSRQRALSPRALRPQRVLAELGEMLVHTLGERVRLSMDCAADVPAVLADASELETALVNLALNARDAMPDGGALRITARARPTPPEGPDGLPPGSYVAFTVADTGTGMSRDVLKRAMDPFFTTKTAGKGTGLGLSMVYGFVRQSGGRVRIESMPGQGTRVELLLPTSPMPPQEEDEPDTAPDAGVRRDPPKVLVVEDEPDVRRVAMGLLRALGYEPVEAISASQALARLHDDPAIRLMFSDVALGDGHTGFELVREARMMRPGLAVLLTSGYEQASAGAAAAQRDGIQLLRKPYRQGQLAEAVAKALEGKVH